MKLHPTLLEKLLHIYEINAGWQEQKKLRAALKNFDVSVYTQADGRQVLVETAELNKYLVSAREQARENTEARLEKMQVDAKRINEG